MTKISFLLSAENVTRPDLFPETLQSLSSRIVPSRRDLMIAKEELEEILAKTVTYIEEGLNVCDVMDDSEYKFVFQCGYGQQLDTDSNMLCSKLKCKCIFFVHINIYLLDYHDFYM